MPRLSEVDTPGLFSVRLVEDRGEESIRLKRLGICVGRRLAVVQCGDPMIVRVAESRIGLSRKLAAAVEIAVESAENLPPVTAVSPESA